MGQPVVHFEIVGLKGDPLKSFYKDLFGWETDAIDANPAYGMVAREDNLNGDGVGIGGALSEVPEHPSSSWRGRHRDEGYTGHVTVYVEVPDVGEALKQAERLGGKTMLGPDELPGGPTIGAFDDPEGHMIGLVSPGAAQ